jgi:hypothetical protein
MSRVLVVGVDPGQVTGIVALPYLDGRQLTPMVLQCDHYSAVPLVEAILRSGWHRPADSRLVLVVEQFVVSTRAAKSGTAEAGRITRAMIADLDALEPVLTQTAGQVKPWATDRRLAAAGLLTPTSKLPHARDAARHALYAGVVKHLVRDPMSAAHQAAAL